MTNAFLINKKTNFYSGNKFNCYAVLLSMTARSHENKIKQKIVIPNVRDHTKAYEIARSNYKLKGEWAEQVGVTIINSNEMIKIPKNWMECEVQFLNGDRWDDF